MVELVSVGGLLLAFFLVVMNGVFVAAEFAFVKIRPTQVNALVEDGIEELRSPDTGHVRILVEP